MRVKDMVSYDANSCAICPIFIRPDVCTATSQTDPIIALAPPLAYCKKKHDLRKFKALKKGVPSAQRNNLNGVYPRKTSAKTQVVK